MCRLLRTFDNECGQNRRQGDVAERSALEGAVPPPAAFAAAASYAACEPLCIRFESLPRSVLDQRDWAAVSAHGSKG